MLDEGVTNISLIYSDSTTFFLTVFARGFAGAFLAGAFLAGAFLAGAFLAGAGAGAAGCLFFINLLGLAIYSLL